MSKSNFLIWAAIAFALGIFLDSRLSLPPEALLFAAAPAVAAAGLLYITKRPVGAQIAVLLLLALLGAWRFQSAQQANEFQNVLNSKQELEGYIVEDIDVRPDKQLVTFQPKGYTQRLLLTLPLGQEYFYGQEAFFTGKITEAKSSADFDYKKYLQRYNIYGISYYPKILVLKDNQQNKLTFNLLKLKYAFVDRLHAVYEEPQRSLILGLLIGAKKTLPPEIIENFNTTGTSHIIAISGYNISIIISALMSLAWLLGRRLSFWLSAFFIAAFVVLTGGSASVIRAATMGGLLLASLSLGRQYRVTAALFFAAFVMLVLNPKILISDVGFQLSFLATMGIVYFVPLFEKILPGSKKIAGLSGMVFTTLSAIVATMPLLLFEFGTVSVVALLVNILILPVIPATMLLGFLSFLPLAGAGFAFLANFLLLYVLQTTRFFARLPFASVEMDIPTWFFAFLVLAVFVLYGALEHVSNHTVRSVEGKAVI